MDNEGYARTGRNMFVIAWLILFGLLFAFFYFFSGDEKGGYQVQHGQVMIDADSQGHYRIKGYINDKPVEFMVDTGASLVAIPQSIADRLHLTGRYPVRLETANGSMTGLLTRMDTLVFGDFHLTNIKGVILPDNKSDTILLGMNVLSLFNLTQKERQLVIKK
ncbi:aspartyl protease [Legionella spiritensis]|uniref:Aspartyl protease n=2 Tax=Legionella spiritensis TaxID=452 RepID=A0A0W0YX46_LEGSP|nr:aspartyl protease [Legionella spiritensis]SNV32966.1 Aspartyl protease [Legionella spiritensis]